MKGEEHYDPQKCQIELSQDASIEAYSAVTELCHFDMYRHLINNLWPNLEDNIMHDVMINMLMEQQIC